MSLLGNGARNDSCLGVAWNLSSEEDESTSLDALRLEFQVRRILFITSHHVEVLGCTHVGTDG